ERLTAAALPRPPDRHGGLAAREEACRRRESSRARDELARDVAGLALQLARREIGSIAQAPGGRRRRIGDERVVADDYVGDAIEERVCGLRRLPDLARAPGLETPRARLRPAA